MEHGIQFSDGAGTYHTYNTWRLVPIGRPIIKPPSMDALMEYMQDVRKALVLNDSAPNELPVYREGEFDFEFESYYEFDWASTYTTIMLALHGRKMKIVLDDDPTFHYIGIVKVDWENDRRSKIKISVECEPFKYKEYVTHTLQSRTGFTLTADTKFITPAIVTINPTSAIITYTMKGLARHPITGKAEDIILKNLRNGVPVIIDGENGLITQANLNKYPEAEFWEFPTLVAGNNVLTFSSSYTNITIKYKPRYL